MDYDDLRREKLQREVAANIESILTLSLALRVAAKFSNGAPVTEGEGLLGKTAKGTFNICYWVRIEGLSEQWVVRFPLMGMLPMDKMTAKFHSEIATLKFLREKTSVRVPKLIGFGLGDNDIAIPFIVTQNVEGLPLTLFWSRFGDYARGIELVLDSLAQQYLELLSHRFDKVGSLQLTPDGMGWEVGTSPVSVDQFDASRDGLEIALSKPYASSLDYYISQTQMFERYINEQRNSVCDEQDAIKKYLTSELFRRVIPHFADVRFQNGPFFLFHLDLHATNVIVNRNWQVEAILDWEFASALPIEVAFSPPRCIMDRHRANEMRPNSNNHKLYQSRLEIFTQKVKIHLSRSYMHLSDLAPVILNHLGSALSEKRAFFAWSASDIRNMFYLLWDHLALTFPIGIENKGDERRTQDVVCENLQELIQEMVQAVGEKSVKDWVAERLASLHAYELERKCHEQKMGSGIQENHEIADNNYGGQGMEKHLMDPDSQP